MKNRTRVLSAAVVMTACIATLAQRDQNVRQAKPGEVPFVYNTSDYETVEIESVPKSVAQPDETPTEQYLDFKTGKGVLFLTQYSQDALPTPINNEELTCNFQGLTDDGKYYVAARLAITHPSLPKGIDFTKNTRQDPKLNYLRREERRLNSFADASFRPSLKSLKSLIASITTN